MENAAEILRLLNNLIRLGTIAEVDPERARARVQTGELLTDWLPWFVTRAGETIDWDPPTIGEQVLLLAESGAPRNAVIVTGLYATGNQPATHDANKRRRDYPDGAVIEYDHQAHHLQATIPGSATIHTDATIDATAGGNITLSSDADIQINAAGTVLIQGREVDINP